MRRQGEPKPHKRDGIWYLIRRVPKEFSALDRRGLVRISTEIAVVDDPRGIRALRSVTQLAAELEVYWSALRDGKSVEARERFDAAQKRARRLRLPYRTAEEIADGPINDLLARLALLDVNKSVENAAEVAAVLGGESRPALRLSGLLAEYEALKSAELAKMSEGQVRKWRNPKRRAIENLISVITDKAIPDIARNDALDFRRWWQDRIADEGVEIATANKDIGHISKMLRTLTMAHQLDLRPVFSQLRIEGAVDRQRAAFDPVHVEKKILASGILDGLNEQARDIIHVLAETGLRPSEVANLLPEAILLDAEVPHVRIVPVGRVLKTEASVREMPLVGRALEAMKRNPGGFARYRDKADSLSALVNKYLANKKLLPSDDHSLYSLRHTFEDRLTAVEAPEKVIASLMGHKFSRPKYGAGPSLAQKAAWLRRIRF